MSEFTFTETPPRRAEKNTAQRRACPPSSPCEGQGLGRGMAGLGLSHSESWGITSPQSGRGPGVYTHMLMRTHAPRVMSRLRSTAVLG